MTTVPRVAATGSDQADGSPHTPFRTIDRAARVAQFDERVVVHEDGQSLRDLQGRL